MKQTKTAKERKLQKEAIIAAKVAAGLAAGVAVTVAGIACLAALYGKVLTNISYLEEGDVYEE